jgi:hypothetical protein
VIALKLTALVEGQLALLVRLQWIAGKRAAEMMSAAPFASVVILRRRISWFDLGKRTNQAQHHHAWVVFDHAHPTGQPPVLFYGRGRPGRGMVRVAPQGATPKSSE